MIDRRRAIAALALFFVACGATVWSQVKKQEDVEGKIRAAAFGYYSATVFGEAEDFTKVTRHPLTIIKDGAVKTRDDKASRALLASFAERIKKSGLTNVDKGKILGNMIVLFDEASVQFVGANSAHLTFLMKHGAKDSGDTLGTLLLHRTADGLWKVFGEITDSAPVPPSYLVIPP